MSLLVVMCSFVFAADLAEMLSADMQKEGVCGKTLTLKLKTASFEVIFYPFVAYRLLIEAKSVTCILI